MKPVISSDDAETHKSLISERDEISQGSFDFQHHSRLGDLDFAPLGDAPTKENNSHASQKYFTPGKIFE